MIGPSTVVTYVNRNKRLAHKKVLGQDSPVIVVKGKLDRGQKATGQDKPLETRKQKRQKRNAALKAAAKERQERRFLAGLETGSLRVRTATGQLGAGCDPINRAAWDAIRPRGK